LIGVFLGAGQPNLVAAPSSLDFTSAASRDYLTLMPRLQQPFFIGDGMTSLGDLQQMMAPSGATRLYLGTMDNYGWWNNVGGFAVQVVPEPGGGSIVLVAAGLAWAGRRIRPLTGS
jgi:hypothetical protein